MVSICRLSNRRNHHGGQSLLEIPLDDSLPAMNTVDLSKCQTVIENSFYEMSISCGEFSNYDFDEIIVNINGKRIGEVIKKGNESFCSVMFDGDRASPVLSSQPFLLQYDLAIISIELRLLNGLTKVLYSDFLLCVSKNPSDTVNIEGILQELLEFDNSQICKWLFYTTNKEEHHSLHQGNWENLSYKSLSSYVQLLEDVLMCYKSNFGYFKTMPKHTIIKENYRTHYEKVKEINLDSFRWLMQNTNQLSIVECQTGIEYGGKSYLPGMINTTESKKSLDVYENRVIVGFLNLVLNNAVLVHDEFFRYLVNEENILQRLNTNVSNDLKAPIITIKSYQVSFSKILLKKLSISIEKLRTIYFHLTQILPVSSVTLSKLPRKTKTFQEAQPYSKVYEIILHWFNYGEFNLAKEKLILQVKTLDKLFEYYCLCRLLKLLGEHGYSSVLTEEEMYNFKYSCPDNLYQNETDIANTYILTKETSQITLYYQPVISGNTFQNHLSMYRVSEGKRSYYTPDFVFKFRDGTGKEEYVVLDSKFSSRENIKRYSLPDLQLKYFLDIATNTPSGSPKMVWALQGRVDSSASIWQPRQSEKARELKRGSFFGIVSINSREWDLSDFWNQMKVNIPWI